MPTKPRKQRTTKKRSEETKYCVRTYLSANGTWNKLARTHNNCFFRICLVDFPPYPIILIVEPVWVHDEWTTDDDDGIGQRLSLSCISFRFFCDFSEVTQKRNSKTERKKAAAATTHAKREKADEKKRIQFNKMDDSYTVRYVWALSTEREPARNIKSIKYSLIACDCDVLLSPAPPRIHDSRASFSFFLANGRSTSDHRSRKIIARKRKAVK